MACAHRYQAGPARPAIPAGPYVGRTAGLPSASMRISRLMEASLTTTKCQGCRFAPLGLSLLQASIPSITSRGTGGGRQIPAPCAGAVCRLETQSAVLHFFNGVLPICGQRGRTKSCHVDLLRAEPNSTSALLTRVAGGCSAKALLAPGTLTWHQTRLGAPHFP